MLAYLPRLSPCPGLHVEAGPVALPLGIDSLAAAQGSAVMAERQGHAVGPVLAPSLAGPPCWPGGQVVLADSDADVCAPHCLAPATWPLAWPTAGHLASSLVKPASAASLLACLCD